MRIKFTHTGLALALVLAVGAGCATSDNTATEQVTTVSAPAPNPSPSLRLPAYADDVQATATILPPAESSAVVDNEDDVCKVTTVKEVNRKLKFSTEVSWRKDVTWDAATGQHEIACVYSKWNNDGDNFEMSVTRNPDGKDYSKFIAEMVKKDAKLGEVGVPARKLGDVAFTKYRQMYVGLNGYLIEFSTSKGVGDNDTINFIRQIVSRLKLKCTHCTS